MDITRIKTEFGLRLKAFRNNHNYTQESFGEIIDLSSSNLSNIENGKTYPDFITLCSIIKNGKIKPDYLLDFLYEYNEDMQSIDLDIMKLVVNLTVNQKEALKNLLESLIK